MTDAEVTYFQWTRGENLGNIETWEGQIDVIDGESFYIFKSGKMANIELEGEFYMPIKDPSDPLIDARDMEGTASRNIPKVQKPVQKPNSVVTNDGHIPGEFKPSTRKQESNPVFALLDKSIKTESTQSIKVNLNLPAKDLIKVVASSFENGQDTVLDYLVSQIPVEDLQNQIKEQLRISLFGKKIKSTNE